MCIFIKINFIMTNIACPQCSTKLEFDIKEVLKGKTFHCTSCNIKITLTYNDNKEILSEASKQLEKIKDELDID